MTDAGIEDGFPHPILTSWPAMVSFRIVASVWKICADGTSRNEMNAQFFSGRMRIDSTGPVRTLFKISSASASAGMLPRYTVRQVCAPGTPAMNGFGLGSGDAL